MRYPGGVLSTLPLELRLRGKLTTLSHRTPIYYVDLALRSDSILAEAIRHARTEWEERKTAGMNQAALDEAARAGFARGEFEESEEDGAAIVEEFYPPDPAQEADGGEDCEGRSQLLEKLQSRAHKMECV
jgi:hypothetical protein